MVPRPILRGYIHLVCAVLAPFALAYLLLVAESPRAFVGAAIFGAGLTLLFTVSAAYHLAPWTPRARAVVGRIDHSTIFIAIAATYTPFCLVSLNTPLGISILAIAWALAGAGVLLKVTWPRTPRWLSVSSYLVVGWLGVIAVPPLTEALSPAALSLLFLSGILYSLGAFAYAARWPNPMPRVFGHHEVFHVMVSAASLVMYAIVAVSVLPA